MYQATYDASKNFLRLDGRDSGKLMELPLDVRFSYNGKDTLTTKLADPEGFHRDMWDTLQTQSQKGILESYNFVAEEGLSPYDFILPIILAGGVLLLISAVSGISTAVFVVSWLLCIKKSAYMLVAVFQMLGLLIPINQYRSFSEMASMT